MLKRGEAVRQWHLLNRLPLVAVAAQHLAFRNLSQSARRGPRPDSMVNLRRRVEMVKFQELASAALDTDLVSEEFSAPASYPLAVVLPTRFRVFERNGLPP